MPINSLHYISVVEWTWQQRPVGGRVNMRETEPVWTYARSRGLYGGLILDGTVIKEQSKPTADFFGEVITAVQISQGPVKPHQDSTQWPVVANKLMATLELFKEPDSTGKSSQED